MFHFLSAFYHTRFDVWYNERNMRRVIVTRHPALVMYLQEIGLVEPGDDVLTHVSDPSQIRDAVVYGVLPLHLAAEARYVVNVPFRLPPEKRGQELNLDEVREYAGPPEVYEVRRVEVME